MSELNWKQKAEGRKATIKYLRRLYLECQNDRDEYKAQLQNLTGNASELVARFTYRVSQLQHRIQAILQPIPTKEFSPPVETKVLGWTSELGYYVTWQAPWGSWNMEGSVNIGPPEYYFHLPQPPDGATY